jgi:hypothetical protein
MRTIIRLAVYSFGAMMLLGASLQPSAAQDKPKATQQLQKANEGAKARDHVFDGRQAPANPVRAAPAAKPSPVGQPVTSTSTTPGYKPQPPRMRTIDVPSPTVSRSTTTTTAPTVSRSSTTTSTPSVSRSSTTTTSTQQKKN